MSKLRFLLKDSSGGAHVYIFGLLAIGGIMFIFIVALNAMLQYSNQDHTKPLIDIATHAAALDIDPIQAALGHIVWDTSKGTASFYFYLRKNLHLDNYNAPLPGSYLTEALIVHYLGFIMNSAYPYDYFKSITLYAGTSQQTTRTIHTIIYGPSVVAIVEVRQKMFGEAASEPIILSSVASARMRY